MATTEILPFATAGGANVESQATYAADSSTATGYPAGILPSAKLNKAIRQSSFMAAGLANFIVSQGISVPDDGNLSNLIAEIASAFAAFINSGIVVEHSVVIAGAADTILNAAQQGSKILVISGTITGDMHIIFEQQAGWWFIINDATLAGHTCTLKMPTGADTPLLNGTNGTQIIWSDGINLFNATNTAFTRPPGDNSNYAASTAYADRAAADSAAIVFATSLAKSANLSDLLTLATALTNLTFGTGAGYFKIPNPANTAKPIIVQYGNITLGNGSNQSVALPVAFPNNNFWAGCSYGSSPVGGDACGASNNSLTTIGIGNVTGGTNQIFFLAIGN